MVKKRVSKKKKLLKIVKNAPMASGLKSVSMRSDYFARFRYSVEEILIILQSESVRSLQVNSQSREILDDLGYWSLVRAEDGNFIYNTELEEQIVAQCKYIERALNYAINDTVWVKGVDDTFVQASIIEHVNIEDSDFYSLKEISNEQKEFLIFSKYELDQFNQVGCFLPQDTFESELIDWDKDLIWMKRLEDFKIKMTQKNFHIDFRKPNEEISTKISELKSDILEFFKIKIGNARQLGRGLGLRSCGEGTELDQFLIYLSAFQAFGHVFGVKLTDISDLAKDFFNEVNKSKISLQSFKSIVEVADKLVARGPLAVSNNQQSIRTIDRVSRKSVMETYVMLRDANVRRALSKALSESGMFSNIVQFNANSI